MRQYQAAALHRVSVYDRRFVITLPAPMVRELQLMRHEYALITRDTGRAMRVEFPAKPFGDPAALRKLVARAATISWKEAAARRPKPRPLVRREVKT